ncbi:hypothetical protein HYP99_gp079 [Sinorhizobium phage ort11]|uniref:Lysozyme n=1 Tax=Sinorhizobium phage ort11 TaxID=2599764 RepID=A0A5C2H1E0_9CAUD|nr:hypothetical protein HYP99_gp079 [Sinorhizobium phage ort11]QEP29877.1 hypothetical protein Smphiort11_079 [Sinorhizobium phage ort11]
MDKFYVYRPLLDLIGFTEGTDQGDGYNETLAYGAMLDGIVTQRGKAPNIVLTDMTLDQINELQLKMLKDPDNKKWNSSALGRYQIVGTTLRSMRRQLNLLGYEKFNEEMQDRLACFLLGQRGIDKYLSGRLKEDTLINQLAMEWASLPNVQGKGHYAGQRTPITVDKVRKVLAEVRERHLQEQPLETVEIEVKVPTPVVPEKVETEVRKKTNLLSWFVGAAGSIAGLFTWLGGLDTQTLILVLGSSGIFILIMLLGGEWIIRRIRTIKTELEGEV